MKHKKNYTKPLKKKEQLQASQSSKPQGSKLKNAKKKVFGKPAATKSHKKRRNTENIQPVEVKETELDEETVQDILENVASDEDDHDPGRGQAKKRKRVVTDRDGDDEARNAKHFEKEHAQMTFVEERTKKRVVDLLPIKTKAGEVVTRTAEMDYNDEEDVESEEEVEEEEVEEYADSDDDIVKNNGVSNSIPFLPVSVIKGFIFS